MAFGDLRSPVLTGGGTSSNAQNAAAGGSATISVGDLLICLYVELGGFNPGNANLPLDTIGGVGPQTWTALGAGSVASGSLNARAYYLVSANAGTLTQVAINAASNANDWAMCVAAFAGPFAASPLDVQPAVNNDTTSPFTCPASGTLAQASELLFGLVAMTRCQTLVATSPNIIAGNALSTTANTANSASAAIGSQVTAVTTTVSPAFTLASGTVNNEIGFTYSFKAGTVGIPDLNMPPYRWHR